MEKWEDNKMNFTEPITNCTCPPAEQLHHAEERQGSNCLWCARCRGWIAPERSEYILDLRSKEAPEPPKKFRGRRL
jgi:hypothetical protein